MMWNIAAVMLIVVIPLALFVADCVATVQRRRPQRWTRRPPAR
jgi:hypothetical protein